MNCFRPCLADIVLISIFDIVVVFSDKGLSVLNFFCAKLLKIFLFPKIYSEYLGFAVARFKVLR